MTHKLINILFPGIRSFVPHSEFPLRHSPQFALRIIFMALYAHVSDTLHMMYYFSFMPIYVTITYYLCTDIIYPCIKNHEKQKKSLFGGNIRKYASTMFGFLGQSPSVKWIFHCWPFFRRRFLLLTLFRRRVEFLHYSDTWYYALESPINLQHHGHLMCQTCFPACKT